MFAKNYHINHIPMVESKSDRFKKKNIHLPAALFNKSPIKEYQNKSGFMNRSNTPRRGGLSPLKSNRQENSMLDSSSSGLIGSGNTSSTNNLMKKNGTVQNQKVCQNHQSKAAKYLVLSDDEQLPYCQKCAILLASQGFKVVRFDTSNTQSLSQLDNHPRRQQIQNFLKEQDGIVAQMTACKGDIQNILSKSQQSFNEQVDIINSYYGSLIEFLENHKRKVIQTLLEEKGQSQISARRGLQVISDCLRDSDVMKEDILSSIQIIRKIEERSFRPVMEGYKEKSKMFKQNASQIKVKRIKMKPVHFNEANMVAKKIIQAINVEIGNEVDQSQMTKQSSVYFSFDNQRTEMQRAQLDEQEQNLMQEDDDRNSEKNDEKQMQEEGYQTK